MTGKRDSSPLTRTPHKRNKSTNSLVEDSQDDESPVAVDNDVEEMIEVVDLLLALANGRHRSQITNSNTASAIDDLRIHLEQCCDKLIERPEPVTLPDSEMPSGEEILLHRDLENAIDAILAALPQQDGVVNVQQARSLIVSSDRLHAFLHRGNSDANYIHQCVPFPDCFKLSQSMCRPHATLAS